MSPRRPIMALALAVAVGNVSAQSICRIFEYAELRDMKRERLEKLYCDYSDSIGSVAKAGADEVTRTRNATALYNEVMTIVGRCQQEIERIDGVLGSKYSASKPSCKAVPQRAAAINPRHLSAAEMVAKQYGCQAPMTTPTLVTPDAEAFEMNCADGKTRRVTCDATGYCRSP